jgi:hypothetical protein
VTESINIPKSFQNSIFFHEQTNIYYNQADDMLLNSIFIYDIAASLGLEWKRPWINADHYIVMMIEEWTKHKPLLKEMFQQRNRVDARPYMIKCIGYFVMSLFWFNDRPVSSIQNLEALINDLPQKPVNTLERLRFVLNSPDYYHSFIQLDQLFEELNKQFQISLAIKCVKKEIPR